MSENKKIVEGFINEAFSGGDVGAVDRYLAEDYTDHDPFPGVPPTRDGMREVVTMFRRAFPDWHSTLHRMVGEGDLVAEHFTARGTNRGEFMGSPATGGEATLEGINIFRIRNGKITDRWGVFDKLTFLGQLGALGASAR